MNNINDILEFRFSKNSFSEKGKNIVPTHILNLCQSRITTLNAITERIGKSMIDEKPTRGIREVYLKFIKAYQANDDFKGEFDKRELRTLSYALNYKEYQENSLFENSKYLQQCFIIFNDCWRDSFISGLLDCYLSNWGSSNKESFNILSNFLTSKIENYKGSRSLYQSLKANSKFFNKDKGDLDLGATLAISNKSIKEATKFLSLPDHWITYVYFQGVIKTYFLKVKADDSQTINELEEILLKHNNGEKTATSFNKSIISKFVLKHSNSDIEFQDKIKDVAFKVVGDPNSTSWNPYGDDEVGKARELLNLWVTRQFIKVFFEKCINDRRRKAFWIKYSKHVKQFKVVGSNLVYQILSDDKRISEYLNERFASTNSKRDRNSALIMAIGDYIFIEFSDEGAFYAYKINNKLAPKMDSKHFSTTSALKQTSLIWLAYRSGRNIEKTYEEGKLGHNDGDLKWEEVADYWIKNIAGIYV